MSSIQDLKDEKGLLSKEVLAYLKMRARKRASEIKALRRQLDTKARALMRASFNKKTRKWENKMDKKAFGKLMAKRKTYHERIAKLVPEKKDPEFDSP